MVLLRKAQMETFGLVIIVILLSFILIFALRFITKPKQSNLEEDYLQLQANNLRSVILKTNLCPAATIKKEIINCQFNSPGCGSCNDLWNTVEKIIQDSIQANMKYYFIVNGVNAEKLFSIPPEGDPCTDPITAVSEPFAGTNLKVSLKLCYN